MASRARPTWLVVLATVALGACESSSENAPPLPDGTLYVSRGALSQIFMLDPGTGVRQAVTELRDDVLYFAVAPFSRILVACQPQLVLLDLTRRAVEPIEEDVAATLDPTISPSGTLVAYRNAEAPEFVIRVQSLSGAGSFVVPGLEAVNTMQSLSWLGDSALALLQEDVDGVLQPWRVRLDGSGLEPIKVAPRPEIEAMSVSRDGKRLALYRHAANRTGFDMFIVDLATSSERFLAHVERPTALVLAWSPDDTFLATSTRSPGPSTDVLLVHVASGATRVIRTDEGDESQIAWALHP